MENKRKNDNKTKELMITKLSCCAAIASAICAIWSWISAITANNISENMLSATNYANNVSQRMLEIEENRKLNENKEKSVRLINDLYEKIMYNSELYDIYNKVSKNILEWNEDYLQRFIDEFEGLWYEYCQEQIYKTDLKTYTYFLQKICINPVIEHKYWWFKNWVSKICLDIIWESWMWKHFNWKNDCRVLE